MQTSKILSVDLIDLIFEGRNKAYGAYELRKTYSKRIRTALFITTAVTALAFGGATLANSFKKNERNYRIGPQVELTEIKQAKPPEVLPEPERKPVPEQVRSEAFTTPEIKDDKDVDQPPPSQDDLVDARIDDIKQDGITDDGIVKPDVVDDGKGIVEIKKGAEPEVYTTVEIPARFTGNWKNFLERNLNPSTPVDNGAAPGRYTVIIQFVVDKEGNVSDIKPLTNIGYGMEEEAVRVLKKAAKWEPAVQNGYPVKAYHKQLITFEVVEE